jgi:putative SOS response-associated peptidase YedK
MCGKFTAMVSWAQIVEETGEIATYRVNGLLSVIVWDREASARKVVPMRWGFPDPRDWRRPRPIHGRAETLDTKEPFKTPFHAGQRGIVVGKGAVLLRSYGASAIVPRSDTLRPSCDAISTEAASYSSSSA